jgi:hypothetical protein
LAQSGASGNSLRDQLESVYRQTGIKPRELTEIVTLPESYRYCWEDYQRLSSTRPSGFGVSPITYTEIASYFNLMGVVPEEWEVQIIRAFDNCALSEYAKSQEKNNKKNKTE